MNVAGCYIQSNCTDFTITKFTNQQRLHPTLHIVYHLCFCYHKITAATGVHITASVHEYNVSRQMSDEFSVSGKCYYHTHHFEYMCTSIRFHVHSVVSYASPYSTNFRVSRVTPSAPNSVSHII